MINYREQRLVSENVRLLCYGFYKNNAKVTVIPDGGKAKVQVETVERRRPDATALEVPQWLQDKPVRELDIPPWLNRKGGDRPCKTGMYQ